MRKSLALAIALGLAAAPAALAAPPGTARPPHPAHPAPPQSVKPPHPVVKVAFIVRGVVTATDAAASTVTIEVKGGNRHARRALAGAPAPVTILVALNATTRITKAGLGAAKVADVLVGDRVVVAWKAPRATTAAQLAGLVARRVVDTGPVSVRVPTP